MASAYATISNNGLYTESLVQIILKLFKLVKDIEFDKEKFKTMQNKSDYSKASAYMVRQVMLSYTKMVVVLRIPISLSNVGAKTGTSNWGSSAKRYGWKSH